MNIENRQELAIELEQLRKELLHKATSPEHYVAIGAVAEAEAAAKENNALKLNAALGRLAAYGPWVWETAQKIAIPIATKALAAVLGMS